MSQLDPAMIARRVRSAAVWPAIAAALMLYFAYPLDNWVLPTGQLARIGSQTFIYTLAVGGWAMAAAGLWLLSGMRQALAFDALASVVIGVLLVASGGLLLSGGGLQPILNVVFGVMFIGSGRQNWREYLLLSGGKVGSSSGNYDPHFERRYAEVQPEPPEGSLAGRLMQQRTRSLADGPAETAPPAEASTAGASPAAPSPQPPATESAPPSPRPSPPPQPQLDAPSEPLPPTAPDPASGDTSAEQPATDGFLAQFAENESPPEESA